MDPANLDQINAFLESDSELRERIKDQVNEFDKKARVMVASLNKIHFTPSDGVPALLDSVKPTLESCRSITSRLVEIVPQNQFWRWKDMWSNSLKTAVFAAVLVEYLSSGQLASHQQVSDLLGMQEEWKDRVALPVEDYLHGVISVVNELSRLAVNSVTLGNFDQPIRISNFVKELFAGFSMLNLKNDTLRRRFDSLKYDMKKIEEEDATWAQAAITLRELVAQRTSHPPSDLVGRANRLISAWPTGDDIPGEGWKSLKENYKKLTNSLDELHKHSDAEVKLLDKSLELITILVALRKAPEGPLTDKRVKRPRASSPTGTPVPGSGTNTRGVSITLPPRTSSVGPSANHKKKDRKGHPLAVNTKVAFWNGNAANRTDDADWILAIIVRVVSNREGRIMYEVRDAEEEGAEVIPAQQKHIIPLPDPKNLPTHEFPVGSTVLGLYPDTSCFYRAEVVATPRSLQSSGGRQPAYKLKFEDDDNQEHAVAAEWVVEFPSLK